MRFTLSCFIYKIEFLQVKCVTEKEKKNIFSLLFVQMLELLYC